jgi:hypothetical protein
MKTLKILVMGALLSATGCGPGAGDVTVSIWGESFIEDAIPPATASTAGFDDGWTVRYTKFLVNVGAVRLASADGTVAGTLASYRVFDLHTLHGPLVIGRFSGAAAQRFDAFSYALAPADATASAGNATAADVQLMQTNRYALYLEATASKPGVADVRYRWGFSGRTDFSACHDGANLPGVAVPTSGSVAAQITVHGDHLYYDDLEAPEARTRFDAIAAADADGDHEVTLDELGRVQLTSLPMTQYGTGPVPDVRTLRDFVTYLVSTVGHFNGEGHCQERRS